MTTCLICGGDSDVISRPPESRTNFSSDTLNIITLFHRILDIPLSECSKYLEKEDAASAWSSFCNSCQSLVELGLTLSNTLDKVAAELEGIQYTLLSQLLIPNDNPTQGQGHRANLVSKIKTCYNIKVGDEEISEQNQNGIGIITATTSMQPHTTIPNLNNEELHSTSPSPLQRVNYHLHREDPLALCHADVIVDDTAGNGNISQNYNPDEASDVEEFEYEINPFSPENTYNEEDSEETFTIENHVSDTDIKPRSVSQYFKTEETSLARSDSLHDEELDEEYSMNTLKKVFPSVRREIQQHPRSNYYSNKVKLKLKRRYTQRNWTCLLCDSSCENSVQLGVHYSTIHNNPSTWDCFVCREQFDKKVKLYKHRGNVHKNLPINKTSNNLQKSVPKGPIMFKKNIKKPLTKQTKFHQIRRNFVCVICDKNFRHGLALGSHYTAEHGDLTSWPCSVCGEKLDTRSKLYCHRRDIHKNMPINRDVKYVENRPATSTSSSPRRKFVCVICDKNCHYATALGSHYATEHGNLTSWPCSICGEEFDARAKLYWHRKDAHKSMSFNQGEDVKNPQEIQFEGDNVPSSSTPSRHFVCLLCDKVFPHCLALASHYVDKHGSPISWPCTTCGEKFNNKRMLYCHRRDFHKNLPINRSMEHSKYKIKPQPKKLKLDRDELENKVAGASLSSIHRNFVCVLCDQIFLHGHALGSHYAGEHNSPTSWPCATCGMVFDAKPKLYVHRRDVHKNLPINRNITHPKFGLQATADNSDNLDNAAAVMEVKTENATINANPTLTPRPTQLATILSSVAKKKCSYVCLLCDATCSDPITQGRHYREFHPNTTEWKCNTCHKVFHFKKTLYVHRRDVHGNLPVCGGPPKPTYYMTKKVFGFKKKIVTQKQNKDTLAKSSIAVAVRKGMYKKKRDYRCVVCQEDCKYSIGVVQHYRKEHPTLSKHLKCSKCNRIFTSYNSLFSHKRSYHKIAM